MKHDSLTNIGVNGEIQGELCNASKAITKGKCSEYLTTKTQKTRFRNNEEFLRYKREFSTETLQREVFVSGAIKTHANDGIRSMLRPTIMDTTPKLSNIIPDLATTKNFILQERSMYVEVKK